MGKGGKSEEKGRVDLGCIMPRPWGVIEKGCKDDCLAGVEKEGGMNAALLRVRKKYGERNGRDRRVLGS